MTASATLTMSSRFRRPPWSSILAMIRAFEPRLSSSARSTRMSSAAPDERQRDEIDAGLDAGADVALVLFGQRRQVDIHAGQVDMPARPELAGRE